MRIKLRFPDVQTFIQKYAVNISRGGIFIATKTPKPIGTQLRFEFLLANGEQGTSLIRGEGVVQWVREFDPEAPTKPHGMGVRFTRLDAESQAIIDQALAFRATQAAKRESAPPNSDAVQSGAAPPNGAAVAEPVRPTTATAALVAETPADEVDQLAAQWGLSSERIAQTLERVRTTSRGAADELESLLKDDDSPRMPPSKDEALAQIQSFLIARPPHLKKAPL